jgi:ferredoxin-NADP reductase
MPADITVERLDDGEVSPYLIQELRPGGQVEAPARLCLRTDALR